eukprot:gene1277-188_t
MLEKRMLYFSVKNSGWQIDPAKGSSPGPLAKWLGICKRCSNTRIISYIGKDREENLHQTIDKHLEANEMSSGEASTLYGRWYFAGTTSFGYLGNAQLSALRERCDPDCLQKKLSPELRACLFYMKSMIAKFGNRITLFDDRERDTHVVITDASCEESRKAEAEDRSLVKHELNRKQEVRQNLKLGGSSYFDGKRTSQWFADVDPADIVRWNKVQPIGIGEALAAIIGIKIAIGQRSSCDVVVYIDNIGAAAAIKRGSSRDKVTAMLTHELHDWLAERDIRLWVCYVKSSNNEADEPSRDGTLYGEPCEEIRIADFVNITAVEQKMLMLGGSYYVKKK